MESSAAPRPPRLKVWLIPVVLLFAMPVGIASWFFFYRAQSVDLVAASSPDTPVKDLAYFARKGNLDVKIRVALNPSTPPKVLEKLASLPTLRYYVIFEPDAPAQFVRAVAEDPKSKNKMLAAAGAHANATGDVLLALSGHADPRIRTAVAENPATPHPLLCTLSSDATEGVAEQARTSLGAEGMQRCGSE